MTEALGKAVGGKARVTGYAGGAAGWGAQAENGIAGAIGQSACAPGAVALRSGG